MFNFWIIVGLFENRYKKNVFDKCDVALEWSSTGPYSYLPYFEYANKLLTDIPLLYPHKSAAGVKFDSEFDRNPWSETCACICLISKECIMASTLA